MNPNQRDNQLTPAEGSGFKPEAEPIRLRQDDPSVPVSSVYPHTTSPGSDSTSGSDSASVNSVQPSSPQQDISKPAGHSPKKHHFESWKSIVSTLLLFILAPVIALSITAFAFQSYQVDGQSMETTLQNQDRLIVNKVPRTLARITHHPYVPKRGDIIVFNQGGLFGAAGGQDKQLIKRVIGLPGERVVVKDGQITVYNKTHPGGYNPDKSGLYTISSPITPSNVDVTLGTEDVFVCGDNRTNSEDSRYFGAVSLDRIVGKLLYRILPINNFEKF